MGHSRGLVLKVFDSESKHKRHQFDTHTGHGSVLKPRQLHLLQFACPGGSVHMHS